MRHEKGLRGSVIRLAYAKRSLRKHLLPLIKTASSFEAEILRAPLGRRVSFQFGSTFNAKTYDVYHTYRGWLRVHMDTPVDMDVFRQSFEDGRVELVTHGIRKGDRVPDSVTMDALPPGSTIVPDFSRVPDRVEGYVTATKLPNGRWKQEDGVLDSGHFSSALDTIPYYWTDPPKKTRPLPTAQRKALALFDRRGRYYISKQGRRWSGPKKAIDMLVKKGLAKEVFRDYDRSEGHTDVVYELTDKGRKAKLGT